MITVRLIRFLPKAHPSGFVYVARLPSAPLIDARPRSSTLSRFPSIRLGSGRAYSRRERFSQACERIGNVNAPDLGSISWLELPSSRSATSASLGLCRIASRGSIHSLPKAHPSGFVYVARLPSAPLIDSRPPLINALALPVYPSRLPPDVFSPRTVA